MKVEKSENTKLQDVEVVLKKLRNEIIDEIYNLENRIEDKIWEPVEEVSKKYELVFVNRGIKKLLKELGDEITKLRKFIYNEFSKIEFYLQGLIEEKYNYNISFEDGKANLEDKIFYKIAEIIAKLHLFKIEKVEFHKQINSTEFDCFMECRTYYDKDVRYVGVEFKDFDVNYAISQAIQRCNFVHVQYIAINNSPLHVVESSLDKLQILKEKGIGLIAYRKEPIPILQARVKRKIKEVRK